MANKRMVSNGSTVHRGPFQVGRQLAMQRSIGTARGGRAHSRPATGAAQVSVGRETARGSSFCLPGRMPRKVAKEKVALVHGVFIYFVPKGGRESDVKDCNAQVSRSELSKYATK